MASFALLCALQKSKVDSPSLSNYTSMGRRIILEEPCLGCSLLLSFQRMMLPNVSPPVFFRFTVLRIRFLLSIIVLFTRIMHCRYIFTY